jgi:DNA-binding NarL/FixJ family response regulator
MTKPVKTLLVDDLALFREAIRTVLELDPRIEIVGEAADGREAILLATQLRPDVILMDLRMPGLSGLEASRRILAAQPEIRILVLTTFDDESEILAVMRSGAAGYVLKNIPAVDLKAAILSVASGGNYMQPATHIVDEFKRLSQTADPVKASILGLLSSREKDILRQLVQGQSNKEIASSLGVAEGTVKNHLTSIFAKFKVPDRTTMALRARELGVI